MSEIAGLVIGTSGLISVAQVCIKAASVIRSIKTFQEETATLYAIYEFEFVRLNLWITQVLRISVSIDDLKDLSLETAELPTLLTSDSPIDLRSPLHNALNEIKRILISVKGLLEKYGATDPSWTRRAGFKTKVYKEGGQEAIQDLLKSFKEWNDRLEGVVESRIRSTLISNMQLHVLAGAATSQQLQTIQVASSSLHPGLSHQALFRQDLMTVESQAPSRNLMMDANEWEQCSAPKQKADNLRAFGRRKRGDTRERVLQEWKLGQLDWDDQQLTEAALRVGKLAATLQLSHKPTNLRCLDLVGYTLVDTVLAGTDSTRLDFCFFYKIPSFASTTLEPLSLRATLDPLIIRKDRDRPTLTEKFGIALALAKSLLAFHSANWLHKAMCSSNVIFFRDKNSNRLLYSEPYVAGFEFSRPDSVRDQTLDAFGGQDFDVFCHPDLVQTIDGGRSGKPRYQRQYDIYGLGIMLLEIGCWRPMVEYVRKLGTGEGKDVKGYAIKICGETIPSRMGARYRDIVAKCLEWEPDREKVGGVGREETEEGRKERAEQVREFMYDVVNVLEECHCRD